MLMFALISYVRRNVCFSWSKRLRRRLGQSSKTKYFDWLNVWKASWHVKTMTATEWHKSRRGRKTPIHQRCHALWADTWHAVLELGHISCRSKSCFLLWRWKTDAVCSVQDYRVVVFFPYFIGFKWLWWDSTHVGLTRSSCGWWIQATCCEWSDQDSFFFFKEEC